MLLGKPTSFNGRISIAHPELEDAQTTESQPLTMQPHYHTSERMKRQGFSSRTMGELVDRAFDMLHGKPLAETLPQYMISEYHLMGVDEAIHKVHRPRCANELPEASRRLKFEELFTCNSTFCSIRKIASCIMTGSSLARLATALCAFIMSACLSNLRMRKSVW